MDAKTERSRLDDAARAGWLYFVAGNTQDEIARKLNVSRPSAQRLVSLAREVGGEAHGFRFIQLPFNLAMPEALTSANQLVDGQSLTILEAAELLGITVISSASIFQGRVARGLPANIRETLGSLPGDAQTAIQFVRSAPGITTALVGMSSNEHVEENLQLARVAPVAPEQFMQLFSTA